jgi:hypothetical protein
MSLHHERTEFGSALSDFTMVPCASAHFLQGRAGGGEEHQKISEVQKDIWQEMLFCNVILLRLRNHLLLMHLSFLFFSLQRC